MKFDGFRLDQSTYDFSVWPVDARLRDGAFRLTQSDFKRVSQPLDENAGFYALQPEGRPKKIDLHKKNSPANLVLFEFRNPPAFSGQIQKTAADSKAWDRVAVFRFPGGLNDPQARADLVFVPAVRSGSVITLETPLDSSAFGSPVLSQEGLIGLVQDQTGAVPLKDAFEALKIK